jgi:hypothetical protein
MKFEQGQSHSEIDEMPDALTEEKVKLEAPPRYVQYIHTNKKTPVQK